MTRMTNDPAPNAPAAPEPASPGGYVQPLVLPGERIFKRLGSLGIRRALIGLFYYPLAIRLREAGMRGGRLGQFLRVACLRRLARHCGTGVRCCGGARFGTGARLSI